MISQRSSSTTQQPRICSTVPSVWKNCETQLSSSGGQTLCCTENAARTKRSGDDRPPGSPFVPMPGLYSAANFSNAFAAEKKYAFTVTAIGDQSLLEERGLTDSITSAFSDVYDPTAGTEEPGTKTWVDIHSAAEWIALANVEDVPSDGTGSPSRQQVEWGKNYRLTADIDFSKLTAAQQTKTKSIGRITYPFMGEFDGQGHKITGLTLSNNDSGLFWYAGATAYIHDLTIEGANVLFSDNAAVLAHNNYGRIEKCAVVNTNITADTGAVLGGMVSRNYGVIRESYVQGGTLTSNTTSSVGHAGFVGANEEKGLIERCWSSMDISTQLCGAWLRRHHPQLLRSGQCLRTHALRRLRRALRLSGQRLRKLLRGRRCHRHRERGQRLHRRQSGLVLLPV